MCGVPSHCELIKPATSVYNVYEQSRDHQSVVHTHSKDFPIHVSILQV